MSLARVLAPKKLKDSEFAEGVIAAGVAEMDYPLALEVEEVLTIYIKHGCVGYLHDDLAGQVRSAALGWISQQYRWSTPAVGVRLGPDTVALMHWTLAALSGKDSELLLPEPCYPRIKKLAHSCGMDVRPISFEINERGCQLNLDDLEAAYRRSPGSVLFLCNPHNPTGKVIRRDHLQSISEVVARHGGLVIADEVHAPLVYEPGQHVPYATVNEDSAAHAVTVISASKGWNLAGLKCAQIVFSNPAHAAVWDSHGLAALIENSTSTLGAAASVAAYTTGTPWLRSVVQQLKTNAQEVSRCINELPMGVRCDTPEASYLAWLDFGSAEAVGGRSLAEVLLKRGAVGLAPGEDFREHAEHCARLNFAMSGPRLREALQRIRSCFEPC